MKQIKFRRHYVTDGEFKARVFYSVGNRIDGRKCVTLYAKDYTNELAKIFSDNYINESDSRSDYFDGGLVNLFEDNIYYQDALKTVVNN